MEMANPAALWLLLVVAAWLLLGRNQTARPRRPVGNLYLWSQPASAAPAQAALRRVRRHWLVLLQAAIMTALVLALARPMFSWQGRRVALVIDVSASMGAREQNGTRMDLARQAARSVIEALPRGARILLIAAGPEATLAGEFARGASGLERALDAITPTASSADLPRAIRSARALGIEPGDIHVISDRQASHAATDRARWVLVGRPAANRAITALASRPVPGSPRDQQVIATIWNYSTEAHDAVVEILQGPDVLSRQAVHLQPRQPAAVAIDVRDVDGAIQARLEGGDALAADDRRFAVLAAVRPARVLLVGGGSFFLERALAVNPAVSLERVTDTAGQIDPGVDVLICERCETPPAVGRAVLMIPPGASADPAPVTISLPQHPIVASIGSVDALVSSTAGTEIPRDAEIVMRSGDHPALLTYEREGRRVVEWRLSLTESSFTLSTAFPILLDNVLAWLDGRRDDAASLPAGEPLQWNLRSAGPAAGVSIAGPDGAPVALKVSGRMLSTTDTMAVGVYRVSGDGPERAFAVNPVTDGESDLAREVELSPPPTAASMSGTTASADQAPLVILLAFALLTLEWWGRSGGRRPA